MGTYMGLAVPLQGGYTASEYTGTTPYWTVGDLGTIVHAVVHNAALNTKLGVGYAEALHVGIEVACATEGTCAFSTLINHTSGVQIAGGQMYSAEFWIQGGSSCGSAEGTLACINLGAMLTSGYDVAANTTAYIKVGEFGGVPMPNLFVIGGQTVDESGGMFVTMAESAAADRGLKITIDDVTYFIMLHSTTAA